MPDNESSSTNDHCVFLTLPAELRNRVYESVVVENTYINIAPFRKLGGQQPPLALTCKQIQEECLNIFYNCNDFRIATPAFLQGVDTIGSTLGPLGFNLDHIRRITLLFCEHRYQLCLNWSRGLTNASLVLLKGRIPYKGHVEGSKCRAQTFSDEDCKRFLEKAKEAFASDASITEGFILHLMKVIAVSD